MYMSMFSCVHMSGFECVEGLWVVMWMYINMFKSCVKMYGKIYGKYIYLYVGESDTCVCEGVTGKMASRSVGGLVCERHIVELHLSLFLYFLLESQGEEGIYEGGM